MTATRKATSAKKKPATKRKPAAKRELVDTGTDSECYVRREADGTFKESDDVGRSLSRDRKVKSRTSVKPGQGDRGDRKR